MDLDDLTDMIEGKGTKKQIFAGDSGADSDDESPDELKAVSHLIDDDEQEQSDLEAEIVDDSDDESESGGSDIDEYNFESNDIAEGEEENNSDDDDADADLENEDDDKDDDEDDSENENEGDSDEDLNGDISSHTYQPTKGEDIYGRLTDDSNLEKASGGKYVPPARRTQLLATIDEVRTLHYTVKH
jgi:hypothetical protein